LGTNTSATEFAVRNSSAASLFTVQGDGAVNTTGVITGTTLTDGTASITGGALNGVTSIDPTTETTIEAAIDTLTNLTSASSLTTVGALNSGSIASGFGNIALADNTSITFGTNTDLTIVHDSFTGSNQITSHVDNCVWHTNTATAASNFQIQNNSITPLFTVQGDGDVAIDVDTLYVDASTDSVGINTSTPQNTLDVGGSMVVGSAYAGDAGDTAPTNGMRIQGDLIIGSGTRNETAQLQVYQHGTTVAKFFNTSGSSPSAGAGMSGYSDDGSAMGSGHRCGFFLLGGNNGSSNVLSAGMAVYASETWSGSRQGSRMEFQTTQNGGTARTTKLTIHGNGTVAIGTASPNSNAFLEVGDGTDSKGMIIPRGTSDPTGARGMLYYNTTNNEFKYHDGSAWQSVASKPTTSVVMGNLYFTNLTPANHPSTTISNSDTWTRVNLGTTITQGVGSSNFTPNSTSNFCELKFIGATHTNLTSCNITFSFSPDVSHSDYIFGIVVNGTFNGSQELTAGVVIPQSLVFCTCRDSGDFGSTSLQYTLTGMSANDVHTFVARADGHTNNFNIANINMFAMY
jgi:hypothetical protein